MSASVGYGARSRCTPFPSLLPDGVSWRHAGCVIRAGSQRARQQPRHEPRAPCGWLIPAVPRRTRTQVVALVHDREQVCGPAGGVPAVTMAPFPGSGPLMRQPAARMAVTPRCRGSVPEAAACDRGSGEDGAGRRADPAGNHAACVMASHADRREAHSQQSRGGSHDRPDLMAATISRQETGAPGWPPVTSRRRRP